MRLCFFAFCFYFSLNLYPQANRYLIEFTDRNQNPYTLGNPSAYLSQRAIDRRVKFGIPIQSNDLPVNPNYIDSVQSKGVTILNRSKWFNAVVIQTNDSILLGKVNTLPFVKSSTHVAKMDRVKSKSKFEKESIYTPNARVQIDSSAYGQSYSQVNMLGGICMHDAGYKGEGVLIAVIDAGFKNADTLHAFDSLRANNQIIATYDFVDHETNVYDNDEHGMNVLSCMGGYVPTKLIGTAPKASYVLLVTEDVFSEYLIEEYNWASAAEYADSAGADVINTSLGYDQLNYPVGMHTYSQFDGHTTPAAMAANWASSKGIAVVAAAGNSGTSSWKYIATPADADSVLCVGAVDGAGQHVNFSSVGPSADKQIKPDVCSLGQGTYMATVSGQIVQSGGTSFSAPLVSGMIACLLQANPTKRYWELFDAIRQSSDQYNTPDSLKGYGIPDFCKANQLLSGIKDLQLDQNKLSIVPNPSTAMPQVSFIFSLPTDYTFSITDITGQTIFNLHGKSSGGRTFIDLSSITNLNSGVYIFTVQSKNGLLVNRFVKSFN